MANGLWEDLEFPGTSRHQSAREETREKKSLKLIMFDSQEYRFEMEKNIQEIRPGRSEMQWYCSPRLFFKNTHSMVLMQLYYIVGCIKTSFYLSFGQTGPKYPV